MYSASPNSSTEPPVSWFARCTASITFACGMLNARSRTGSRTIWYCLTMPPTLATSDTFVTAFSSYLRNQSCSARSCDKSMRPLRSTSAYSYTQPTPLASGPSEVFACSVFGPAHARFRRLRAFDARRGRPRARLGVDEELAGDDDLVAFGESLADFALAAHLEADLDLLWPEFAVALGDDDHAALAGAYDRLGWHEQRLGSHALGKSQRREHTGLQSSARIGE